MTVEELAKQTLAVLDQQREYFRTKGKPELMKSKAMEKALRMKCEDVLKTAGVSA